MTKLITSDVDRYLSICAGKDAGKTYADLVKEFRISRSVVSKILTHRKEHPEFEKDAREIIAETERLRKERIKKKKVSTKRVPNSTKSVPISTKSVPKSTLQKQILLDEFEQLETYFRKGKRPSMAKAISNFKKHLGEI